MKLPKFVHTGTSTPRRLVLKLPGGPELKQLTERM